MQLLGVEPGLGAETAPTTRRASIQFFRPRRVSCYVRAGVVFACVICFYD